MSKRKGSVAERQLQKLFWENGWPTMRAAGSGSTSFPCPDLICGRNGRRLCIEVKITKDQKKYFSEQEIRELRYFAHMFGAEAWVAVKFPREEWLFFALEDLRETGKNFVIALTEKEQKGLLLSELID